MDVFPDFGATGGATELRQVVGALLMFVLIIAVLMLIVCAITWALASSHGNYQTATRARTGLLVALGTAVLAGAGVGWLNWLITLGSGL
ncbi:DUF6112 family protein [Microbacterium sp. NPDC077057]|uniref:DUF6112 family protein n=1 Tax=Microbacterium sp. NPDC077057 TaxID=3154763 RepID=UPI00341F7899